MRILSLFTLLSVLLYSCKEEKVVSTTDDSPENESVEEIVEVMATSFIASNQDEETIKKDITGVTNNAAGTWYEYQIDIPKAGRYRFELEAQGLEGEPVVWMEDYVDNEDGRTYDVTGPMDIHRENQEDPLLHSVEGSPLNAGVHKMRLHVDNGSAKVSMFRFVLIKALVKTPSVLTQSMKGDEWDLVWSDEFNEGETVDTDKWTFDFGDWGWGNKELQYYTIAENTHIEDGNLVIEARKDEDGKWTSARLTTREKVSFVYGRIEFKAKVPVEKGNWSAGWMLGDAYVDELSWPYCGEIDIMESVGYEIDDKTGEGKAHASVHCGAYYFKLGNHPTSIIDVGDMKNEYHIYRIDWSKEKIIAYVDDQPYFEFNDTSSQLAWPFNDPQNIILNLAMGGGWGGAQGMDESVTSQKLYVDYVRVYGKK